MKSLEDTRNKLIRIRSWLKLRPHLRVAPRPRQHRIRNRWSRNLNIIYLYIAESARLLGCAEVRRLAGAHQNLTQHHVYCRASTVQGSIGTRGVYRLVHANLWALVFFQSLATWAWASWRILHRKCKQRHVIHVQKQQCQPSLYLNFSQRFSIFKLINRAVTKQLRNF